MKEKKNKKKLSRVGRIALDIIMVVCLGVAIFSGYQLYKGLASYNQAGNAYDNLRKNAVTTKKDTDKDDTTSTLDFQKLLEQNPDCAGWLTLPNSNVDYPVVFGASTDENKYGNSYYLDHCFCGLYIDNPACLLLFITKIQNGIALFLSIKWLWTLAMFLFSL